jgi:hypothetical protein
MIRRLDSFPSWDGAYSNFHVGRAGDGCVFGVDVGIGRRFIGGGILLVNSGDGKTVEG